MGMNFLVKKISIFCLILVLMVRIGNNLITIISFKLNQDELAARFCVNINKPIVMCNGKCLLIHQLSSEVKNQEKSNLKDFKLILEKMSEWPLFFNAGYFPNELTLLLSGKEPILVEHTHRMFIEISVFKPPKIEDKVI